MRLLLMVLVVVVVGACGSDGPSGLCTEGETRECYTGPLGSEGVGTCKPGIETCINGEFSGICVGDVIPFVEHCDGVDEDCNGEIDDVAGAGEACSNAEGCDGATACSGTSIVCVGPERNECGLCGGTTVADIGTTCVGAAPDSCAGTLQCNGAGDGTICNAPVKNECGLCGGPEITGLADECVNAAGDDCPGLNICNDDGDNVACSCNPQPGMCRANGVFRPVVSPAAGDLVITEIMQSPSGDDTKQEWFEVEVMANVDLNQLEVDRVVGDSLDPDVIQSVDCISVTTGTRLLFARSAVTADNGGLPAVDFTFSFALIAASTIELRVGATTVDTLIWTSAINSTATQLDPDSISATANDVETNFCAATTAYNGVDLGTPGAVNTQCPIVVPPGSCLESDGTTVRAIVKPTVGQLVITEVFPDPANGADATQEWFEIKNVDPTLAFDLNGLGLKGNGATIDLVASTPCKSVAAGGFALFARSDQSGTNGGLPAVDATFTFTLANSNGSVSVLEGATDTVLDAVSWTNQVQDGRSRMLLTASTNTVANDSQANFCNAPNDPAHDYDGVGTGTNLGTPKAQNDCP